MLKKNGFTLIELVMVIIILGILAAVAIPKYYNLANDAKSAAEKGVVGNVRAGIHTYYAQSQGTWPSALDAASVGVCSSTNVCFSTVLAQEAVTSDWEKTAADTYEGPTGASYVYDDATGTFK
jgi:prepilin-type N-terminal cleavage/methylation domain-containing protein